MNAPSPSPQEVTRLLADWSRGDKSAFDKLAPLVHGELRRLAHRHMRRERPGHTLQTTALVNEAYLRLADQTDPNWQNRAHFFAVAAQAMRHVLVNYALARGAEKRGGGQRRVELDEAAVVSLAQAEEVVALHEALERLSELDPRKTRVVELRYFGGLTAEEVADVLKVSPVTVRRDWEFAKAWLRKQLAGEA